MYAASSSPRSARMRWRRASISWPKASSWSGVRRAFVAVLVMGVLPSQVDDAVADGSGDTDLDVLVGERGLGAGEHVADRALGLAGGAGEADAHPAAEDGRQPRRLGLLEDGGTAVGDLAVGPGEGEVTLGRAAGGRRGL